MDQPAEWVAKNQRVAVLACIVLLMVVSIVLRLLLVPHIVGHSVPPVLGADPWYAARQIELMVAHYPGYAWFDPMTAFPTGKMIDWGPLFPFLGASAAMLTGALAREEILFAAAFVPPILAALTVPLMYLLGRTLYDWKAGIVAAAVIAIIPGGYFLRTSFGFLDHHGAEVLFSTLFCLLYIMALRFATEREFRLSAAGEFLYTGVVAAGAGIAFLLGLLVMPTMILFAMIVAIFTFLQYVTAPSDRTSCRALAFVNTIAFAIVLAGYSLFMIQREGFSLATYTVGQSYVCLLLVIGTLLLFLLSHLFGTDRRKFALGITGAVVAVGALILLLPSLADSFFISLRVFFGAPGIAFPIQEMEPMGLLDAWSSFNVGIFLLAAGIVLIGLGWYRGRQPHLLFVLAWAAVVLVATAAHVRYEYYLAVIVALAAGATVSALPEFLERRKGGPAEKKSQASGKKGKRRERTASPESNAMSLVFLALVLFGAVSLYQDVTSPERYKALLVPDDWAGSLEWLSGASPDPGVEYLGVYPRENWTYPSTAYGVLSLWDYGHLITVLGRRIPNSNPFQDHALGRYSTTAFLMAPTEEGAEKIATRLGSRYIITENRMANTKFVSTAGLYNSSRKTGYYTRDFLVPREKGGQNSPLTLLADPYYHTMIARLHALDGSLVVPDKAFYLEYREQPGSAPVVTRVEHIPYETAREKEAQFSGSAGEGTHAAVLSSSLTAPLSKVPALLHYRLVYESPHRDEVDNLSDVKIFERVRGAQIRGEGTIELMLVTNQGRTFTYRQESRDGVFVVPYSTVQNPYPVRSEGPYRIAGTSLSYEVTEEDVREGRQVSAG
ncbi:MAG: Dolichyl-monophosphooligosaccharide--protein glycosyltransferase AglB [Methanoregulaceae archaeon PtaB.Bin056]|nr:MAG: Dolichyl-monophosphooligosaccharide--protein glycosyltransferase AglB [Methanoregulaceae archaeon PtaB.Bin056]